MESYGGVNSEYSTMLTMKSHRDYRFYFFNGFLLFNKNVHVQLSSLNKYKITFPALFRASSRKRITFGRGVVLNTLMRCTSFMNMGI